VYPPSAMSTSALIFSLFGDPSTAVPHWGLTKDCSKKNISCGQQLPDNVCFAL
jgi:hypothetical protein